MALSPEAIIAIVGLFLAALSVVSAVWNRDKHGNGNGNDNGHGLSNVPSTPDLSGPQQAARNPNLPNAGEVFWTLVQSFLYP